MRTIRSGVFETNSSSTHSICISKAPVEAGNFINFDIGEYGWENRCVANTSNYLYTMILSGNDYDEAIEKVEKLKGILESHGVNYKFEEPRWNTWDSDYKYLEYGYVDHAYDGQDFVDALLNDEDMLMRYLFGNSFIYTGNDNQDADYAGCYICSPTISEYDRVNKTWIDRPNPYHDAENYDYFFKGN